MELINIEYGIVAVQKGREQCEGYTNKEIEREKLEREIQGMLGHHTYHIYKDTSRKKTAPELPYHHK